jgi:transcriptional regulator with XRE-family HTH domain
MGAVTGFHALGGASALTEGSATEEVSGFRVEGARIDLGKRFLWLQERYRKPDGSKWTNVEIERATGGFVRGNYVTNLVRGRIHQPGTDRLQAIAQVMGFPAELWLSEDPEELFDSALLRDPPTREIARYMHGMTPEQKDLILALAKEIKPKERA